MPRTVTPSKLGLNSSLDHDPDQLLLTDDGPAFDPVAGGATIDLSVAATSASSQSSVVSSTTDNVGRGDTLAAGPASTGDLSLIAAGAAAAMTDIKSGALKVFDTQLAALYYSQSGNASMQAFAASVGHSALSSDGQTTYVTIDATANDGNGAALLAQLQAAGLQGGASFGTIASGYIDVNQIGNLLKVTDLAFASESAMQTHVGLVTTQADVAQHNDTARTTYSVDGTGIKVGILSDSFNLTAPGGDNQAADIASGDLPAATTILQESSVALGGGEDEGRGMAQLVHDLAPGAAVEFATANGGIANFANNIIGLATAGCQVIVDDVGYFAELYYQEDAISQAVDQVVASGHTYFSSSDNSGNHGYEGFFVDGGQQTIGTLQGGAETEHFMQFAPGQNYLTIDVQQVDHIVLQWDQPANSASGPSPGATGDLDLFITNAAGDRIFQQAIAGNIGGDPVEIISLSSLAANQATGTNYLRVGLFGGAAPTEIKIISYRNNLGAVASNFNDGTTTGHPAADSAIGVAAARYADTPAFGVNPPTVETFSSGGPVYHWYDTNGNRFANAQLQVDPWITAVDGGNTTFFVPGGDDGDADTFPNFYGTSAAAPDAAATAALMLQARPTLNPTDIKFLLVDSAIDMDNPNTAGFDAGFDYWTGAGLIQADRAVGFAQTLVITGSANNDVLYGTHLNDTMQGGAGNDFLQSAGGDDVLDGGTGADTMYGSSGNDSYFVDNAGDQVVEPPGSGTDTVYASINYTLPNDVEILVLQGSAAQGFGNAAANTLYGNGIDNLLNGGAGADTMAGGAGNDSYIVDNAGDAVVENANEGTSDTVFASVNYTLGANLETLILQGAAAQGYGNAAANTLYGTAGDNLLDGQGGADTMSGGAGNDVYFVDNIGDAVIENANEGNDTIFSTVSLTLGSNVENLILQGAADLQGYGNALVNTIYGNTGNNLLNGDVGADLMAGGLGNDVYFANNSSDACFEVANQGNDTVFATVSYGLAADVENLILQGAADLQGYGNAGANTIYGNTGNNLLNGGAGADLMAGGTGNDVYYADNSSDACFEAANEGNDTVFSTANYGLAADVENLIMQGAADLQGYGSAGANALYGNSGNNLLNGRGGADQMLGGAGNDIYYVDNIGDSVSELANQGNDTVFSSVDYALSANVENLILQGAANLNGFGNSQINTIYGNAGINNLDGGAGADILTGNAGNDVFIFHPGEANGDTIADFTGAGAAAGDLIHFTGYAPGATFTFVDATHWQVTYNGGASHDIILFQNAVGGSITNADFAFV